MKNKFLSIALILVLSVSFANAQENSKTSFGILGGVNFQTLNGKISSGDKLKNDMLLGFHGGINVQIPIVPGFYIQPGLMYAVKGAKNTTSILGSDLTDEIKLNYLEMPLNLVYKAPVGNGFFMLGFGPYVAYVVSGKEVFQRKSTSYEKGVNYNALDAGGNIFVGFEMASGIFLQVDTQLGMLDIDPDANRTAKNTGFGLSVGYRF